MSDLYLTGDLLAPYLRGQLPLDALASQVRAVVEAGRKAVVLNDDAGERAVVMHVVQTGEQLDEWLNTLANLVETTALPDPMGLRLYEAPRAVGQVVDLDVAERTVRSDDGVHTVTHVLFRTAAPISVGSTYYVMSPSGGRIQFTVSRVRTGADDTVVEGIKLG